MKITLAGIFGIALLGHTALGETISVPGKANPWLAGATNSTIARRGDVAPDESPVLVVGTPIQSGNIYRFYVSGSVNHGAPNPFVSADGETMISHYLGAENGIADVTAPFCSLIGVFLGPTEPDSKSTPPPLDFRNQTDRDYLALAPVLRQPFFIGDGLTSSNEIQQVIAPAGATRLFLGVMDEYNWSDNEGAFNVEVTAAPANSLVHLSLHPSLHPESTDAVANTAAAITQGKNSLNAASINSPNNPPTLTSPGPELHAYTAIEISWPSEINRSYRVQWTPSLNSPQWANLDPIVSGSGAELSLFDSTRTHPQGFYRVQIMQ